MLSIDSFRKIRLARSALLSLACAIGLMSCKSDAVVSPALVQQEVYGSGALNYLLFMPANSTAMEQGKYPLILSLHGIGERGNDLQQLKRDGLPRGLDGNTTFPFIVISPQCPVSTEWYYDRTDTLLIKLLDQAIAKYPIDVKRIYLTGYSMGGIGTWDLALRHPDHFAGLLPIASRAEGSWNICVLKPVPVWAFHGAKDEVVDVLKAETLVKALRDCGGNVKLTIYPEAGHDAWTRTYNDAKIYDWLLQQRR